jgi:hypothetical protein
MIPPVLVRLLMATSTVAMCVGCSPVKESRIGIDAPPDTEESFGPLGDMLDHRCGTLDCHGQIGRNLRIWGCDGMRLQSNTSPASCSDTNGGSKTTPDEHSATYRSLVGLEPNVMSAVYDGCQSASGSYPPPDSCHPELLTFVRKARGTEAHKGGQLITVDGVDGGPDPQDVCIVTWLEGQTDRKQCSKALGIPNFPVLDASTE